jgi:mono/diheme cytochrome c family protein
MRRCARPATALLILCPFSVHAEDQPLNAKELLGRNLFTQSCIVCHIKTQVTAGGHYGPDLSKASLGGQADVMRDLISNGTPNMPGFKYHFTPDQIDAIVAYLKTVPVPAPARPSTPAQH